MALTITTGDSADSQQINEVKWVVRLLEGGRLDPNSGVEGGVCGPLAGPAGEAARYTGVQDDDDVLESGRFYDPDRPSGAFGAWPRYPGLMDRAQVPFEAAGLNRPSYVAFGNHDGTVQGNLHALQALDDLAKGCVKPLSLTGLVRPRRAADEPRAADRRAARPRARLRRPADVPGAARHGAPDTTRTASASSTRPSSRPRAGRPPTTRSRPSPACG